VSNIYDLRASHPGGRTAVERDRSEGEIDGAQRADAIIQRNPARYRFVCDNVAFIPRGLFDDIEAYGLFLDRGMAALAVYDRAIGKRCEAFPLLDLNGAVQGYQCRPRVHCSF